MRHKNYEIRIGGDRFDAIQFGSGQEHLVILPGQGDTLTTVRGKALTGSLLYRRYAEKYTVTMISRKTTLQKDATTRTMARDQALAMQALGIQKAHILGVALGGMVAQYLAIDHPSMVDRLVLVSTAPEADSMLQDNMGRWIGFAQMGSYLGLMIDITEKSHTERKLKKLRPFYPYLGSAVQKADMDRFCISARACLSHDATDELDRITAPTLVLAGEKDRTLDVNGAHLLHRFLPGSTLKIYEGQGHSLLSDEPDFCRDVLSFLDEAFSHPVDG